ncbi:MAG: peptidoglycan bridge formation glycyltransferase FemA/FemB family protein [Erysipelotrichaceae bacterium]
MKYQFQMDLKAEELDAFVKPCDACNILQSSKWALVKENWNHLYLGVREENQLVATAMVLIKPLPLGYTMFYLPKGPILDYNNQELLSFFLQHLKQIAKQYKCLFIKIDPNIIKYRAIHAEFQDAIFPEAKKAVASMIACGCIHLGYSKVLGASIQPRFHSTVYFNENDFENNLPKHTKRHIQTAKKRFVEIKQSGLSQIEAFTKLTKCTSESKNIALRDQAYFEHLMKVYGEDAQLFIAQINLEKLLPSRIDEYNKVLKELEGLSDHESAKYIQTLKRIAPLETEIEELRDIMKKEGTIVDAAGTLAVIYGSTCEMLYMGMDRRFQRYMAAYVSHVEPMKWALSKGCKTCNMGGIEGSLDDGLTKFKDNFNPMIVEFVGEFELPVNKLLYRAAHIAFNLRKKLLAHHS